MKHRFLMFISSLIIAIGVMVAFYPSVNGNMEDGKIEQDAETFIAGRIEENESAAQQKKDNSGNSKTENSRPDKLEDANQDLLDFMNYYNKTIYENGQKDMVDPYSFTEKIVDLSDYGIENECIGTVYVPAMDIELPIYVGATSRNLLKGAAYVSQTSFPIGGKNTNSVICGHRGYNGSKYFRDIEKMQVGDHVYINNLWQTLVYQVTEIKLVNPNAVEEIKIQEGKDMVTLMTCHPYIGHKYRYLIYCERTGEIPYTEESRKKMENEATQLQERENAEPGVVNQTAEEFKSSNEQIFWDKYAPIIAVFALFALYLLIKIIQIIRWKMKK